LPAFAAFSLAISNQKRAAWLLLSATLVAFAIAYRVHAYAAVADATIDKKVFALLQLPGLIDHFAIGMLLAWVYVRHAASVSARLADGLMLAGFVGIASMMALLDHVYADYWNGHILIFVGYTITACFIGMLVLGTALGGPLSRGLFANPIMLALGIVSYSLYLWHLPIQTWTVRLLDHAGVGGDRLWWLVVISIPASIAVASLSYYWIERPFMPRSRIVLK
jgi:peptidoglycan/LPS O-acetylase OafA/YrhL